MSELVFEKMVVPSTGIEITIVPVSETLTRLASRKIEKEYRARGEPIDPPKYRVKIDLSDFGPGGEPEYQYFEHDETTLEQVDYNDFLEVAGGNEERAKELAEKQIIQNKRAWAMYREAVNRLNNEQNLKTTEVMLMRGVRFEMPEDDSWVKAHEELGIEIPDNAYDLRYHYLTTEVILTPEELMSVVRTLTKLSMKGMLKAEQIDAAADTFQDILRGGEGQLDIAGGTEGTLSGQMEKVEVENVDEVPGSESGDESAG